MKSLPIYRLSSVRLSTSPSAAIYALFALAFALAATPVAAKERLNVGSKRFTESYILGDIITQVINRTGEARATHKEGLGNTGIVFAALTSGNIDIYPEYNGTISLELLKNRSLVSMKVMNEQLKPMGLAVGIPLGFNDTYALAMRNDQAQKLGIRSISDLAKHPELKFGISQELLNRSDGWPGLKVLYGMPQTPQGIDHGLAYEAISGGQIDVTDIYSTDAKIAKYNLRVLNDDRNYFPRYDAVLIYRRDLPKRFPATWLALRQLTGKISAQRMIEMNADVELNGNTFSTVASNFVNHDLGFQVNAVNRTSSFFAHAFGDDFWTLTGQHLYLVFVSLLAAVIIGVPLGILATRSTFVAQPILAFVGLVQTIPSLALLAVLIPLLHRIGDPPTLIALFLYSLLPIVRNTYTGLTDISPPLRESAIALGLRPTARLRLIELPLAARSIMSGIKTSAVINVGTATIAAFIGAGGYGQLIAIGYATADNTKLVAGAIAVGVLALIIQGAFDLLDRWLVPKGLRVGQHG